MRIVNLIITLFILSFISVAAQQPSEKYFEHLNQTLQTVREKEAFIEILEKMNTGYGPLCEKKYGTTRFFFVRHGESLGNKESVLAGQTLDVDLTPEGFQEAIALGKQLNEEQSAEGWSFENAFSSPSLRAKKTAEAIISQLSPKSCIYNEDRRIIEKHSGKFDGKKMDAAYFDIKKAGEVEIDKMTTFWDKFVYKFDWSDEKEESLQQVYDRTMSFVNDIHRKEQGKTILVATHSVVMKALFMVEVALHHHADMEYHRFELPNCSILVIDVNGDENHIIRVDRLKFREIPKH